MNNERRRHPRHPVRLEVDVSNGHGPLEGELLDLSPGGVAVVTDDLFERGETIRLSIPFSRDAEEEDDDHIEMSTTVRWTRTRSDGRCVTGLSFDPLTAAQKRDLSRLASLHIASSEAPKAQPAKRGARL